MKKPKEKGLDFLLRLLYFQNSALVVLIVVLAVLAVVLSLFLLAVVLAVLVLILVLITHFSKLLKFFAPNFFGVKLYTTLENQENMVYNVINICKGMINYA